MKTQIYLVRHGQSLGNLDRLFLGHTDLGLTEKGEKQAECVASFFEDIHIDAIYSSDLLRAYNTALPLSKKKDILIKTDAGLRELYAGAWEKMAFEDIPKKYSQLWADWQSANASDLRAPDGESFSELLHRVKSSLTEIANAHKGESVAVFLHAITLRLMINDIEKRGLDRLYETPWVANASISKLCFENGNFFIEYLNSCEHMGSLTTFVPRGV